MEKIRELNRKKSLEEESRKKAQQLEPVEARVSARDSNSGTKANTKEEKPLQLINLPSRYDNETVGPRDSPTSNQPAADSHNTSEHALNHKLQQKSRSKNLFDMAAEE